MSPINMGLTGRVTSAGRTVGGVALRGGLRCDSDRWQIVQHDRGIRNVCLRVRAMARLVRPSVGSEANMASMLARQGIARARSCIDFWHVRNNNIIVDERNDTAAGRT